MTIEEFTEQIIFASSATKERSKENSVRILVKIANKSVILNVKEIGFNDKENLIYIEASE